MMTTVTFLVMGIFTKESKHSFHRGRHHWPRSALLSWRTNTLFIITTILKPFLICLWFYTRLILFFNLMVSAYPTCLSDTARWDLKHRRTVHRVKRYKVSYMIALLQYLVSLTLVHLYKPKHVAVKTFKHKNGYCNWRLLPYTGIKYRHIIPFSFCKLCENCSKQASK